MRSVTDILAGSTILLCYQGWLTDRNDSRIFVRRCQFCFIPFNALPQTVLSPCADQGVEMPKSRLLGALSFRSGGPFFHCRDVMQVLAKGVKLSRFQRDGPDFGVFSLPLVHTVAVQRALPCKRSVASLTVSIGKPANLAAELDSD